jgi:hypothetical protein
VITVQYISFALTVLGSATCVEYGSMSNNIEKFAYFFLHLSFTYLAGEAIMKRANRDVGGLGAQRLVLLANEHTCT